MGCALQREGVPIEIANGRVRFDFVWKLEWKRQTPTTVPWCAWSHGSHEQHGRHEPHGSHATHGSHGPHVQHGSPWFIFHQPDDGCQVKTETAKRMFSAWRRRTCRQFDLASRHKMWKYNGQWTAEADKAPALVTVFKEIATYSAAFYSHPRLHRLTLAASLRLPLVNSRVQ